MFRAAVPSGASTGIYEAVELRDAGKDYMGKGELNSTCRGSKGLKRKGSKRKNVYPV